MSFRSLFQAILLSGAVPVTALAQPAEDPPASLVLELNALQDVGEACRLTFVARNNTATAIDQVVFETVIFDTSGGVASLSLFDFRDLPMSRPRVRQFDLPGMACDAIGKTLINGASTCLVDGSKNDVCDDALSLSSRLTVELLG